MLSEYKEKKKTGYDWLPEVPVHWEQVPIWTMLSESDERNGERDDLELLSVYREYGVIKKRHVLTIIMLPAKIYQITNMLVMVTLS